MGSMTSFLLLLWLGVTVSTAVNLQKRIIGGRPCEKFERRYHVKLIISNKTHSGFCGGSLISNQWILTAAHCRMETIKVHVGVHPRGKNPIQQKTITEEPKIFIDKQNREHDIMLLKLPSPVDIKPVDLPLCGIHVKVGDEVQIAGHGATAAGPGGERKPGKAADLHCAKTAVVKCPWIKIIGPSPEPYQHMQCSYRHGVDACDGDSGGGVVHNSHIYGVLVQTGDKACSDTADFMDVCADAYKKWIQTTTGLRYP